MTDASHLLTGRLSLDALPFWRLLQHQDQGEFIGSLVSTAAASVFVLGAVAVIALITWFGRWRALWFGWLTSVDHKKIGIMYVALSLVMLTRGVAEAVVMRTQQALGASGGFLSPDHFAQLFSTHGTIMIFFMAMPFLTGIINFVMPLQIGARDVSFPVLNSVSLGLTAAGAMLVMVSLMVGEFSTGGWSGYPPYTGIQFNPGVGPDYWIWALMLAGLGSTFTGINFAVTIYKQRAPGMHLFRMPLFTWTALCTSILMIFAMPPLTVATSLLALDRYLGFHFFTSDLGGNMMNFANLFWLFGHPEVYIVVLPAFGVYSEVFATFSSKALYGYKSLVWATMVISVLSFTVWVHHFFTMGQSADMNAIFGIATMLIGIPTGVKIYDWILTMYRGRVRFTVPLVYSLGFVMLFAIGGLTGILLANPSIDYQVHNSLFLVAHFHNMLIPGTLFGMLAAYHFWFPKAFGYRLDERWGMVSALCWIVGFMLAFFPLYALGFLGMPRRTVSFTEPAWEPFTAIAFLGASVLAFALFALLRQLWVSVREREQRRVPVGDPWDGRSLEWAVAAPPPEYNFAVLPTVLQADAFAQGKATGTAYEKPLVYRDIEMPNNSALGMVVCVASGLAAFGLVWHIWWLVLGALVVLLGATVQRGFARGTHRTLLAADVERQHQRWLNLIATTTPVGRERETEAANRGLALPMQAEGSA